MLSHVPQDGHSGVSSGWGGAVGGMGRWGGKEKPGQRKIGPVSFNHCGGYYVLIGCFSAGEGSLNGRLSFSAAFLRLSHSIHS